jgi:D-alanyl-D-alanine endopeptidase (penicillin-binding protein 7)
MRFHPASGLAAALDRARGSVLTTLVASLFLLAPTAQAWAAPAKKPARHAVAAKAKAKAKPAKKGVASARKAAPAKKQLAARKAAVVARTAPTPAEPPPLALVEGKPVLKAHVAYVVDQDTGEVLLGKNDAQVRPIASLTKLMTGVVIADAQLPMDERIVITDDDVDRLKGSSSRLRVGTELTRAQALHLALMSSENRAAHALARTFPGGESAFVSAMNNIARQLGMKQTRYVEPTGLSSANRSSAHDLALLADAAYDRPLLRKFSTSPGYQLATGKGSLRYVNTNALVRGGEWPIGLQKTGYISEAGQCLLVQTKLAGRNLIMVFLDSATKVSRIADARIVRRWLRSKPEEAQAAAGTERPGT